MVRYADYISVYNVYNLQLGVRLSLQCSPVWSDPNFPQPPTKQNYYDDYVTGHNSTGHEYPESLILPQAMGLGG